MEIDATNQATGRLATKIALVLRGKTKPSYQPSVVPTEKVIIKNASKMKITGKKMKNKKYYHYSGYPGGMKSKSLGSMMAQDPCRVLRMAVNNMLAPNKLRAIMLKNLIIEK